MMSESSSVYVSMIVENNDLQITRVFTDMPEYELHFQRGIGKIISDKNSTKIYDRDDNLMQETDQSDTSNVFYIEDEVLEYYGTFSEFNTDINVIKDQFDQNGFNTLIDEDGILSAINDSVEYYMDTNSFTTAYYIYDEEDIKMSLWSQYIVQNEHSVPIVEVVTKYGHLYSGIEYQRSDVTIYEDYEVFNENGEQIIDYTTNFESYKSNEFKIEEYDKAKKKNFKLEVFPNPAEDVINVELPYFVDDYLEIKIYNSMGKMVYSKSGFSTGTTYEINISDLPSGIYIVKAGKFNTWKSAKFIRK